MTYIENGYLLIKNFCNGDELKELHSILLIFHEAWKKDNSEFYSQRAINSAYITGTKYLGNSNREKIFQFISSEKMMNVLSSVMPNNPMFMNTQLFFNPVNLEQKNYCHRDPQYVLSPEEHKKTLTDSSVVHFRIPLMDEPGIELVPGTHLRWDTEEEFDVRLEKNGKKNSDSLSTGCSVRLEAGDLLVFSANMIHRGLYGMERFAFDIIFCDAHQSFADFIEKDCLPTEEHLKRLKNPSVFKNSLSFKS